MKRTFEVAPFVAAMSLYKDETAGFIPQEWIRDHRNIALWDGVENYNLFEYDSPGVYWGHTFYNSARGRDALRLGKESLDWVFSVDSPVLVIKGLTPLTKLGARWFNKKLGFTSHGVAQTVRGPEELFILDRPTYHRSIN